jgi:hypothetical protein
MHARIEGRLPGEKVAVGSCSIHSDEGTLVERHVDQGAFVHDLELADSDARVIYLLVYHG